MAKEHASCKEKYIYTVEDCDCRLCLYYGGKRVPCLAVECVCVEEWLNALEREGMAETVESWQA